ncbi:hypothetical protein D3C75_1186900 [compost metagenome]
MGKAVLQCIFHQRLQAQLGYKRILQLWVHLIIYRHQSFIPVVLDVHVGPQQFHLLPEVDQLHLGIQCCFQQLAQSNAYVCRIGIPFVQNIPFDCI